MVWSIGSSDVWALASRQHGVVSRAQLTEGGLSRRAIEHRVATGRLHALQFRGVYAVGRPELSDEGLWMAAVLACGEGAALSHASAASLWGIRRGGSDPIEISTPARIRIRGIKTHQRATLAAETTTIRNIPLTQPLFTLVDLAASLKRDPLEAAINEADKLGLITAEALAAALDEMPPRRGIGALRRLLARHATTDSNLERRFLRLVSSAGLPKPQTGVWLNGFKTDFHWPQFGLVVETDGLTYHRTPAQQARDRLRDQAHTAAGLTQLRFTNAQIRYERQHVAATLRAVIDRLAQQGE
jgi:very-short-patch-repair endonuclease